MKNKKMGCWLVQKSSLAGARRASGLCSNCRSRRHLGRVVTLGRAVPEPLHAPAASEGQLAPGPNELQGGINPGGGLVGCRDPLCPAEGTGLGCSEVASLTKTPCFYPKKDLHRPSGTAATGGSYTPRWGEGSTGLAGSRARWQCGIGQEHRWQSRIG